MRDASDKIRRIRSGSTLIEILVALGILVPVIIVAVGIFPFSHVADQRAWHTMQAYDLARAQLELVRSYPFDAIPPATSTVEHAGGSDYTVQVQVDPAVPGQNPVLLKRVVVRVQWNLSGTQVLQFESLVARLQS